MFDLGWPEMLVIAIVLIVVVGPKDLPRMLRSFGRTTTKLRAMAGDFRKQFDDALKEAELDEVRKSVDTLRTLNPTHEIKKHLNPMEKAAADVKAGLDTAMKPSAKPVAPPAEEAKPAEPLKAGPATTPGDKSAKVAAPAPLAKKTPSKATPAKASAKTAAKAAPRKKITGAKN
jgi:sec-independent protein translocase protein TatB